MCSVMQEAQVCAGDSEREKLEPGVKKRKLVVMMLLALTVVVLEVVVVGGECCDDGNGVVVGDLIVMMVVVVVLVVVVVVTAIQGLGDGDALRDTTREKIEKKKYYQNFLDSLKTFHSY